MLRVFMVIVSRVRADQHDVPDHGPGQRPADAACDFRRAQHAAVFSERRRLSAQAFPGWMQAIAVVIRSPMPSTPSRACCSRTPASARSLRPDVPDRVLDSRDDCSDAAVQEDAVTADGVWPKGPKTTQDLRTRDRLLQVAAEMFADRGFKKVTVREICRRRPAPTSPP